MQMCLSPGIILSFAPGNNFFFFKFLFAMFNSSGTCTDQTTAISGVRFSM